MKALIYYQDKLYAETTFEEIEKRHPKMQTGDRFHIDDDEVIVTNMVISVDDDQIKIITEKFK